MFDVLKKLVDYNKQITNLRGVRIENGIVTATNLITTASFQDSRLAHIDCYVDASEFINALDEMQNPVFTQTTDSLTIKDGKLEVSIPVLDSASFQAIQINKWAGTEVPPVDFIEMIQTCKSFLKQVKGVPAASLLYIESGYAYATDTNIIVRIPFDTPFGNDLIILPKEFIDLLCDLKRLKKEICHIEYDDNCFCVKYLDDSWIHTTQDAEPFPFDFGMYCKPLDTQTIPFVEQTFKKDLQRICSLAKESIVEFKNNKISTKSASIDYLTKSNIKLDSSYLGKVLEVSTNIDFNYINSKSFSKQVESIIFSGEKVSGLLTVG